MLRWKEVVQELKAKMPESTINGYAIAKLMLELVMDAEFRVDNKIECDADAFLWIERYNQTCIPSESLVAAIQLVPEESDWKSRGLKEVIRLADERLRMNAARKAHEQKKNREREAFQKRVSERRRDNAQASSLEPAAKESSAKTAPSKNGEPLRDPVSGVIYNAHVASPVVAREWAQKAVEASNHATDLAVQLRQAQARIRELEAENASLRRELAALRDKRRPSQFPVAPASV